MYNIVCDKGSCQVKKTLKKSEENSEVGGRVGGSSPNSDLCVFFCVFSVFCFCTCFPKMDRGEWVRFDQSEFFSDFFFFLNLTRPLYFISSNNTICDMSMFLNKPILNPLKLEILLKNRGKQCSTSVNAICNASRVCYHSAIESQYCWEILVL